MAVGYNTDGSEAPLYDLGWAGPSGQMYSTVNDLMKVLNRHLSFLVHSSGRYKELQWFHPSKRVCAPNQQKLVMRREKSP